MTSQSGDNEWLGVSIKCELRHVDSVPSVLVVPVVWPVVLHHLSVPIYTVTQRLLTPTHS